MALGMNESDTTMENVMKNIYSSCDTHNMNMVPTSKLIDFIMPFMQEDLPALENLKSLLDPNNKNVFVSSDEFYQVMNEWTKKITSPTVCPTDDFNITPSQLDVVDEKLLPFIQSTPRASFGQKLLRNEGLLLNLSNESIYNLSASTHTKENNTEKTVLEEEVKKLDHQLHKVLGELDMVKMQLAQTEEQNENLHADLERCRTRLGSEQQLNEHLNKNKNNSEELKEEISFGKRRIEELNKKLSNYEKENAHLENYLHKIEKENVELEERLENYKRREQELKKEMFDMKTELDMKDLEVASITKLNDELKLKLSNKKKLVDQLTNENELLDYKKQSLEKIISSRRYSTASSHYTTCLAEEYNSFLKGTIPIYSSPPQDSSFSYNSPDFIKRVLAPVSPTIGSPIYPLKNKLVRQLDCSTPKTSKSSNCFDSGQKSHSLNDLNMSDGHSADSLRDLSGNGEVFRSKDFADFKNGPPMSLQDELFQVRNIFDYKRSKSLSTCDSCLDHGDTINSLKIQNESLQNKFHELTEENKRLNTDLAKLNKDTQDLKQKLSQAMSENCALQESLKEMQNPTNKTEEENVSKILEGELNILKAKLVSTENELGEFKKKFNFEPAYKSSQMDLNDKNTELSELRQTLQRSKDTIQKLTNRIKELEVDLDKSKQMLELNRNIEQTANQVQQHIDNQSSVLLEVQELKNKLKDTIETKEKELHEKMSEITNLKKVLKSEEDVKNIMWRNQKKIHIELENLKAEQANNLKDLEESEEVRKNLKDEYNALLARYNEQTAKSVEMLKQITDLKKELANALQKYNEEYERNAQLCKHVTALKNEVEFIRTNQKDDKENINRKLSDYESRMQNLDKINENLTAEIEVLRNKVKEDGISEELCNNLTHFQQMLVNLETQISDLENEKEILRSELECERKKSKKDSDGDVSDCSSWSGIAEKLSIEPKHRSFEKQKLTIDRLKERLEHSQAQLLNEKSRCEVLRKMLTDSEEKYSKLTGEVAVIKEQTNSEQRSLHGVIDRLRAKLKSQEDSYKRMCHDSNEKLEEVSLKLAQFEERNVNLLADLAQREALIQSLNAKTKEDDTRHQNLFAELATKEIRLRTASQENTELKNLAHLTNEKLIELTAQSAHLESDLAAARADLILKGEEVEALLGRIRDKDGRIRLLTATVQEQEEKLSRAFLELTCKEGECRTLLDKQAFLEKTSTTDDHKEKELMDTEQRLRGKGVVSKSGLVDVIAECNRDLSRTVSLVTEKWNISFENNEKLPSLRTCETLEEEESLLVLNDNIKVAVSLLEVLSTRAPSSMDESENQITVISNAGQLNSNDPKTIKKFTLRPSRLVLNRPVSPDSPSVDLHLSFESPKVECTNGFDSPDSRYCEDLSFNKRDSVENGIEDHSDKHLSTFPLDLPFQDAFPNVSDNFLEKLGLQEGSPKQNLSKDETEKLFATFAIQIALDSRDVKDRLQKQKRICAKQHKKCFYLIKDISMRLRDHRCIGASDPINPVFVLLEDVRFLLQEIVQSSGQLGILTCENRMAKCWNLVTNYMAMLKQGVAKSAYKKIPSNKSLEDRSREVPAVEENTKVEENGSERKTSGKPAKAKEQKEESTSNRRNWFTCVFVVWILLFAFLFLTVLISIHWQCRMTTDNQVCPLDDFIKKIQTGSSPY